MTAVGRQIVLREERWRLLDATPLRSLLETDLPGVSSSRRRSTDHMIDRATLGLSVQADVVPRLVRALDGRPRGRRVLVAARVEEFARLVTTCDLVAAMAFVAKLDRGLGPDSLYLDLLAPAARHLGELWTEDRCHFTEVTLGLSRLQRVLRVPSPAFQAGAPVQPVAMAALLVALPEEQHTFGLSMLTEFFHRADWRVAGGSRLTTAAVGRAVRSHWFDVVGFSLGSETRLDVLTAAIRSVRRASRNPHLGVMVGGPIFHLAPHLAREVGADATASDGPAAVMAVQALGDCQPTRTGG